MHKKHIYVIYTGGTIGMRRSEQGYVPVAGYLQQQLQQMPKFHHPEMPSFFIHECQPLIDSSDMSPLIWQQIAEDIEENYARYHGFVILHGTDTMAFTASALSFMLENLTKPVIITGSLLPLYELRSDGQNNLLYALYLAAHHPVNEVCLFFDHKLFRGNRVTKVHMNDFDAFASPNFPVLVETSIHIHQMTVPPSMPPRDKFHINVFNPQLIGILTLYPGMDSKLIHVLLKQPLKALIIKTYGLGNAPRHNAFLQAIQQVITCSIPVVNVSQCLSGRIDMQGYANGHALADIGVISGSDMTLEATLAKLHYLLAQSLSATAFHHAMMRDLRGELTEQSNTAQLVSVA